MKDHFGREINYMRISITDKCNLRCKYCMPEGIELVPMTDLLTFEEIVKVCEQAVKVGIKNIKITGGEPLVRRDAPKLIGMINSISGIESVSMTTNGVLLKQFLHDLKRNGLKSINISLDTMDPTLYQKLTGKDAFTQVMDSIFAALDAGLRVKLNTVLLQGYNENEWEKLVDFARRNPVAIRFIEIMPIGQGKVFSGISNQELINCLKRRYPEMKRNPAPLGNGPAIYYSIPGFQGDVGFISALHGKFCDQCNRIRMSAQGELKPCLCYGKSIDLRDILRHKEEIELENALRQAIAEKPQAHCFERQDEITEEKKMISIGG